MKQLSTILYVISICACSYSQYIDEFRSDLSQLKLNELYSIPRIYVNRINEGHSSYQILYDSFLPVLKYLKENPEYAVEIRLHRPWNYFFSEWWSEDLIFHADIEADTISAYLVSNGIDSSRITSKIYELEYPIIANEYLSNKYYYMDLGDTLDYNFLYNKVLSLLESKYNKKLRKKKIDKEFNGIRSILYDLNRREEVIFRKSDY